MTVLHVNQDLLIPDPDPSLEDYHGGPGGLVDVPGRQAHSKRVPLLRIGGIGHVDGPNNQATEPFQIRCQRGFFGNLYDSRRWPDTQSGAETPADQLSREAMLSLNLEPIALTIVAQEPVGVGETVPGWPPDGVKSDYGIDAEGVLNLYVGD